MIGCLQLHVTQAFDPFKHPHAIDFHFWFAKSQHMENGIESEEEENGTESEVTKAIEEIVYALGDFKGLGKDQVLVVVYMRKGGGTPAFHIS